MSAADPAAALHRRAEDYAPGDTDLSWTRTTLWRGLCASAFDSLTERATSATVSGEASNPSRALLAGWFGGRLGLDVQIVDSVGPGVTGVRVQLEDCLLDITRNDGRTATLSRTDQPDRGMPLPRRDLGDLLAEELRRLDADETYAEALEVATGQQRLSERSSVRTHVWQDPAQISAVDPALALS